MEVGEDGLLVSYNTTKFSHYRGFFMYYCISGFPTVDYVSRINPVN